MIDKTPDQAADDVRSTEDYFTPNADQATADALGSKYNPLNWIPNVAHVAGGSQVEGTGSPAAPASRR